MNIFSYAEKCIRNKNITAFIIWDNNQIRIEYENDFIMGDVSDYLPVNGITLDSDLESIFFDVEFGKIVINALSNDFGRVFKSNEPSIYMDYVMSKTKVF